MELISELIFASKNKGKVDEVRVILEGYGIRVRSMAETGVDADVLEDGDTFEANAVKKATEIMRAAGAAVLADDSGLEIDYLGGAPGVLSSRFLGEDTPYGIKNQIILDKLKDAGEGSRGARYVCVMALALPGGETVTARGALEGEISREAKGSGGFGYDPIFYVPALGKTLGETPTEEKNRVSHRRQALDNLLAALRKKI